MPRPPPPPAPAAPAPAEQTNAESEFVVILAALLCALICILGLFAVARCTFFRRNAATASSSSAASNKGLKKKTLRSLPKFTYTAPSGSSKHQRDGDAAAAAGGGVDDDDSNENNECAICLAEFADGEEIRVLPQCGHRFHVTCVDTWLGKHSSCPKCRRVLVVGKKCGRCGAATADEVKRTCDPSTSTGVIAADFLP